MSTIETDCAPELEGPRPATSESGVDRVRVWDLPTRVFHWALVVLVAVAASSKLAGPEWWLPVHLWAGYALLGLMTFRFLWAVFGSHYSHIASFAYHPRRVIEYLRGVMMLRPAHHIGHNPAGAVMIIALAVVLVGLVTTGLLAVGGEEKQGWLAGLASYDIGSDAKTAHWVLFLVLAAMVVVHLAGVVVESILHRENLVAAMVHGWKTLPPGTPRPAERKARPRTAALWMVGLVTVGAASGLTISGAWPHAMPTLPKNAAYESECSACHALYHPSLLPAASWRAMLAGLDNHFGEDASLDAKTTAEIEAYLLANSAEHWDTEAANRFVHVNPREPLRITATPYWKRKHAEIPAETFARESVLGKSNCAACHSDARSGRFDDAAIRIPEAKGVTQ